MYADPAFFDGPDWSDDKHRRNISFIVAAFLVAGLLSLFRLPQPVELVPIADLIVNIVSDVERVADQSPVSIDPVEVTPAGEAETSPSAVAESEPTGAMSPHETASSYVKQRDWSEVIRETAAEMNREKAEPQSVNPVFDEKRRVAREKFRPIEDPRPGPIWENVETDHMGRKLLQDGDCYKILDDPNVGSREKFLTFGQFMVHCSSASEKPKNLPWVDEVNARRGVPSQHGRPAVE